MATNAERETTIRWDLEERVVHVWTNQNPTRNKLDKLVAEFPDVYRRTVDGNDENGSRYEFPPELLTFRKPPSEARREASRQRALARGFGRRSG